MFISFYMTRDQKHADDYVVFVSTIVWEHAVNNTTITNIVLLYS